MKGRECPNEAELSGYVFGDLVLERATAIDAHLDLCQECETKVSELETQSDFIIEKLRTSEPVDEFANEPAYARALHQLERLANAAGFLSSEQKATQEFPQNLGQYQLLEKLGQGGMGTGYRALHRHLKRIVALKVLPTDRFNNAETVARFEQEMYAAGQLNHPNIVVTHDAGEADGKHYLVMELVEGVDLSKLVKRYGPLNVADACELIRQSAAGLGYAHKHGMIHRDIKPSNLMLGENENGEPLVKILDMGLALLDEQHDSLEELTTEGQTMGTLEYMAPEQGEDSHQVDARADIYSLGCTFYKLLCGETPFPRRIYNTPIKLMKAIGTKTPPSISEKRELPEELVTLIDKMLAREPAARPANADEVADALSPFTTGCDCSLLLTQLKTPEFDSTTQAGIEELPADDEPNDRSEETEPTETLIQAEQSTDATIHPPVGPTISTTTQAPELKQPARTSVRWKLFLTVGLLGVLLFAGIILLPSKHGYVRVEIHDPSIQVTLNGEDRYLVTDKDSKFEILAGKHTLHIKAGGTEFETKEFTVTRNNTTALQVSLLAGSKVRVLDGEKVVYEHTLPQVASITGPPKNQPSTVPPVTRPDKDPLKAPHPTEDSARKFCREFAGPHRRIFIEIDGEIRYFASIDLQTKEPFKIVGFRIKGDPPLSEAEQEKLFTSNLKDVRTLMIEYHPVTPELLSRIQKTWPALESLDGFPCRPELFEAVSTFEKLKAFRLANVSRAEGEKWIRMLIQKKGLVNLSFALSNLTPELLESLQELPNLTSILFSKENFGDEGLAVLGKMKNLENLRFNTHEKTFTHAGLMQLQSLQNLHLLQLFHVDSLKNEDVRALKEKLPFCELSYTLNGKTITLPAIPRDARVPFDSQQAVQYQQQFAEDLKLPVEFTNSIGMKFRLIPPGTFEMGNERATLYAELKKLDIPRDEKDVPLEQQAFASTMPRHQVILTRPWYLGVTEVTQKQFKDAGLELPNQNSSIGEDIPVTRVTWEMAVRYCNALSQREELAPQYEFRNHITLIDQGNGYRLPTEAEWVFACQSGKSTILDFGGEPQKVAWYDHSLRESTHPGQTAPVGKLLPNAFGLYDMQGNLYELCQDFYSPTWYEQFTSTPAINPTGPATGKQHVFRGAHYAGSIWEAAMRRGTQGNQGFRLALPVEAVRKILDKQN